MQLSVLYKKCSLILILFSTVLWATDKDVIEKDAMEVSGSGNIQGKIIDNTTNEPLVGANIQVLNTYRGATTNQDGMYEISYIPAGEVILIVSYMGYKSELDSIEVEKDEIINADFNLMPGILESSTIVVTGTATPYLYKDAPVKTEVIHRKIIEQTQSCNLAEALSLQTGLRVENNCQNCNFTQVRILGFDGKYSQVLIDGDPVVSSLAGVYALEQFPEEMIGQIEVVKGGGSALYGSGAMAGTINLRTKQPSIDRFRVSYKSQYLDGGSIDQRAGAVAEIVSNSGDLGGYVFGSARKRDPYDHNGDSFSELGLLKYKSIGANLYLRPLNNGELQASFHYINEDRRGGNDFDKLEHHADIAESLLHKRFGGKLRWLHHINNHWNYQAYYSFSLLDRDSYYGGLGGNTPEDSLEALNYYGTTKNRTNVLGLMSTYSLDKHQFTLGGQYSNDYLDDKSVKDPRYYINNTYTNMGFFLQDDFKVLHDHLNLVVGARVDKHSEMDDPVLSPRLNIKYSVTHELNLRAAYTTGFRAPETFDEDLHIESLGGEQRVVRMTPGLKPERSQSVSTGFAYDGFIGKAALLVGITGFYAKLDDAFVNVEGSNPESDLILWYHVNSDGATVSGIELDLGYKPNADLELRAGLTYQQSAYDSEQEIFNNIFSDRFLRTPDTYGHLYTSYNFSRSFSLFGSAKYTGIMYVPNETTAEIVKTTQDFIEFDLGIDWQLSFITSFDTKLAFGLKNITNAYQHDLQVGVNRDPAYLYGPQLPRRLYFGIDVSY